MSRTTPPASKGRGKTAKSTLPGGNGIVRHVLAGLTALVIVAIAVFGGTGAEGGLRGLDRGGPLSPGG